MKFQLRNLLFAAFALALGGCATNSVKNTWESPACKGRQFKKIAILAADEREIVRQGLESRFLRDFRAHGQAAMDTWEVLPSAAIKADKAAAAARFRADGADVILIVRLVDQTTYEQQAQASPRYSLAGSSGYANCDWFDFYSFAGTGPAVWSTTKRDLYLDSSLFDLQTGQRLWSALTLTVLSEDADKLVVADGLVKKIVERMHADGLVPR